MKKIIRYKTRKDMNTNNKEQITSHYSENGKASAHMVGGEWLNDEQKKYMNDFLSALVNKVGEWNK